MKDITHFNTLDALIKDESMAHKEYAQLAKRAPPPMNRILMEMSADEWRHHNNLVRFKAQLKK